MILSTGYFFNKDRCGTWMISQKAEREHSEVLRLCRKFKKEMLELAGDKLKSDTFKIRTVKREKGTKGGRPIKELMLNQDQVIFLISLFRVKSHDDPVLRFKVIVANDIVEMGKKALDFKVGSVH